VAAGVDPAMSAGADRSTDSRAGDPR